MPGAATVFLILPTRSRAANVCLTHNWCEWLRVWPALQTGPTTRSHCGRREIAEHKQGVEDDRSTLLPVLSCTMFSTACPNLSLQLKLFALPRAEVCSFGQLRFGISSHGAAALDGQFSQVSMASQARGLFDYSQPAVSRLSDREISKISVATAAGVRPGAPVLFTMHGSCLCSYTYSRRGR